MPVSENFFPLLGVQPQIGRLFNADECKWNGPKAVLLSDGLWKRRFASDPGIVGRKLTINDEPVTVVGVLPASFDFATVFSSRQPLRSFHPFPLSAETNRWGNTMAMIGRLKPGIRQCRTRRSGGSGHPDPAPASRAQRLHSTAQASGGARERTHPARPVGAGMRGRGRDAHRLRESLEPAAGAHGDAAKEMAIRAALGAGRRRLIRQMLTESMRLSCCGAASGRLYLAAAGTRVLARLDALSIPLLGTSERTPRFAFCLLARRARPASSLAWSPRCRFPPSRSSRRFEGHSRGSSRARASLDSQRPGGFGDRLRLRPAGRRRLADPEFPAVST